MNKTENKPETIPVIEEFLLSTIRLTDETRASLLDILIDILDNSTSLPVTKCFGKISGKSWFPRCGKVKMNQLVKYLLENDQPGVETEMLKMFVKYILGHYTDILNEPFYGPIVDFSQELVQKLKVEL